MLRNYIKIARPDHWIKNFFVVPGTAVALLLVDRVKMDDSLIFRFIAGFFATCFIASANYVINEWLDADFDKYHPTKKNRPVVTQNMRFSWVMLEYVLLIVLGFLFSVIVGKPFFLVECWLLVMGIIYNVKPMRTKDIPYLDVLSESVNNCIRFLLGWYIVTSDYFPPVSILIGYWFGGAFLMAMKRFAEYRMIGNPSIAGQYRKSFKYYSEKTLLISSFFYAMTSTFFIGIFMTKYRMEYIYAMPFIFGLFCFYLGLSFKTDSAVQKPEKLYHEKGLLIYILLLTIFLLILTFIDFSIPQSWLLPTLLSMNI